MKWNSIVYLFIIVFLFSNCNNSKSSSQNTSDEIEKVININDIANKSIGEVNKILGAPTDKEKVAPSGTPCKKNPCDKLYYQNGKYEIVFINNVADWITINNVSNLPLNESVIYSIGLPASKPSFSNPSTVIRWTAINNIKEISFFNNGSNKVNYIYIKVNTD